MPSAPDVPQRRAVLTHQSLTERIGAPMFVLLGMITAVSTGSTIWFAAGAPNSVVGWVSALPVVAVICSAGLAARPGRLHQPRRARLIASLCVVLPAFWTCGMLFVSVSGGTSTGIVLMALTSAIDAALLGVLVVWARRLRR